MQLQTLIPPPPPVWRVPTPPPPPPWRVGGCCPWWGARKHQMANCMQTATSFFHNPGYWCPCESSILHFSVVLQGGTVCVWGGGVRSKRKNLISVQFLPIPSVLQTPVRQLQLELLHAPDQQYHAPQCPIHTPGATSPHPPVPSHPETTSAPEYPMDPLYTGLLWFVTGPFAKLCH